MEKDGDGRRSRKIEITLPPWHLARLDELNIAGVSRSEMIRQLITGTTGHAAASSRGQARQLAQTIRSVVAQIRLTHRQVIANELAQIDAAAVEVHRLLSDSRA
jgi:metal-responsive CopG/Arc/MetJ family transcriptional regulator